MLATLALALAYGLQAMLPAPAKIGPGGEKPMELVDLDCVRREMLEEFGHDVMAENLYRSPRLTEEGWPVYRELLLQAILENDGTWLAEQIRRLGLLRKYETRRRDRPPRTLAGPARTIGRDTIRSKVPDSAADTLAHGQFNHYYMRGVCRRAIATGQKRVKVYRARKVSQPRRESQRRLGWELNAEELLEDLRAHPEEGNRLRVPGGPNSGLSIRLLSRMDFTSRRASKDTREETDEDSNSPADAPENPCGEENA